VRLVLGFIQAIDHLRVRLDGRERSYLLRDELLRLRRQTGKVVRRVAASASGASSAAAGPQRDRYEERRSPSEERPPIQDRRIF
jgi:hypothetical protein